jgi:hypothetical protein
MSNSMLEKFGFALPVNYEKLVEDNFDIQRLKKRAERIDCQDMRAQKCYKLLHDSLQLPSDPSALFPDRRDHEATNAITNEKLAAIDRWNEFKNGRIANARQRLFSVSPRYFEDSSLTTREQLEAVVNQLGLLETTAADRISTPH